jgi:hypothetical protein
MSSSDVGGTCANLETENGDFLKRKREEDEINNLIVKRRRLYRVPVDDEILVSFSKTPPFVVNSIVNQLKDDETQFEYPGASAKVIENRLVRIYPNTDEKREIKRGYNKKAPQKGPLTEEQKEAIKLRNKEPEVAERKKKMGIAKRKFIKEIKQQNPDQYKQFMLQFFPNDFELKRKPRKYKKNGANTSSEETGGNTSETKATPGEPSVEGNSQRNPYDESYEDEGEQVSRTPDITPWQPSQ